MQVLPTPYGCKIDDLYEVANDEDLMEKPDDWTAYGIVDMFFGLAQTSRSAEYLDAAHQFQRSLAQVGEATDRHEYEVNDAANSGIVARLILFQPKRSG